MKYIKKFENLKQEPVITYYKSGLKLSEEYYLKNSKRHREDGPAVQWWYENGQKESEIYYLNYKSYSRENWLNELKDIGSPHYEEQLLKYEAEKYNL